MSGEQLQVAAKDVLKEAGAGSALSPSGPAVTVWCLLGKKAGDNTQVLALANQLGYGYVEKRIVARPWELLVHLGRQATLAGINRSASDALHAPWPDLVISAGRRNEPVAQWIRAQSAGRSRLVHMGRPWAPLALWDLIITTPQYNLPAQANILHNRLPLHRLDAGALENAAKALRPKIAALARPWICVLVGGDSGRFVLTPDKAANLGALASRLAQACGGSLLVTDSPRTPSAASDALSAALTAPHVFHRHAAGGENPYRGFLASADAFVVTGESMSMLGEAAAMQRPLLIFDVGDGDVCWWRLAHGWRYKPLSHRLAMRFGPPRMQRDIGRIQASLVESGAAQWLSTAAIENGMAAAGVLESAPAGASKMGPENEDLKRAAIAVRLLLTAR